MRSQRLEQAGRQGRPVAGREVSLDVGDAAHARNGRADRGMLEDEPQRQFRQVHALGHQRQQALDPIDRVSEVLFGLIMVLTFTGSLSVAEAGHSEVRTMLVGALGCNLAWGIIDASSA